MLKEIVLYIGIFSAVTSASSPSRKQFTKVFFFFCKGDLLFTTFTLQLANYAVGLFTQNHNPWARGWEWGKGKVDFK